MTLRAADWVQVRSKEEILATLDVNGRLDGMPFMPQMFRYCGKRFQVSSRAHKTCDTVSGAKTGEWLGRRVQSAVHLQLRCDGEAYGGCQAGCLIFWKEAWLTSIDQRGSASAERKPAISGTSAVCTEQAVWEATKSTEQLPEKGIRYACQATELVDYTQPLKWWDARQYVEDLTSGNVSLAKMLRAIPYFVARRPRLGRPARWLYNKFWGVPFPWQRGVLDSDKDAPMVDLQLQPGDLVRVRPHKYILTTIDKRTKNRGMGFDAEMVPYCGKVFRVRTRVEKFIDEGTGYMRRMKTPAVILEGVYCQSRYSENRLFCPRAIFAWWREIWLERISEDARAEHQENASKEGVT
jgi:hypothetical protein